MKRILLSASVLFSLSASAQYYYKDIIGTGESAVMMRAYQQNKVTRVVLKSYDADGTVSDNFNVEQVFVPAQNLLTTTTRTGDNYGSTLFTLVDAEGRVTRTIDSSEVAISTTTYQYNAAGQLVLVQSVSTDAKKTSAQTEDHVWHYAGGDITGMWRIKNKIDTAYISFKKDDKGNIIEEQETRRGVKSEPVYYYYDASNRLTDIVRFNRKANRLLPEYMFEYSPANQVIQKITVPSNSDQYLIWRYQYNAQGLKTKENVYNKQKQLTGKIEYLYSFGS